MITFFWKGGRLLPAENCLWRKCQGIKLELGEAGAAEDDAGGMLMCSVLGFI
jgi:hypothetical protein